MASIFFHHAQAGIRIPDSKKIKEVISAIFKENEIVAKRVDYIFCSDEYLLQINKKFLKHNYFTDIITFKLNEKGCAVIGEVYISMERIKENARQYMVSQEEEILRVIFHGALHLCRFNDKTLLEKKEMKANENYYIDQFKVSRNTVSV